MRSNEFIVCQNFDFISNQKSKSLIKNRRISFETLRIEKQRSIEMPSEK